MNSNFSYYMPTRIVFGQNTINSISSYVAGRKTLLVTSNGFLKRGLLNRLSSISEQIVSVFSNVNSHPEFRDLEKAYDEVHKNKFDLILAVGGGSVIDASKFFSIHNSDKRPSFVSELARGQYETVPEYFRVPLLSVPTTAGSGSEITPWATIWDTDEVKKYSLHLLDLFSEVAIYDPTLTISAPKDITIQSGLDALSHSLESIWNKNASQITLNYATIAAKLIIEFLPKLIEDLSNMEAREQMQRAAMFSALAFSNTQTAIAHALSYFLTLKKKIPHGLACSITLPMIVEKAFKEDHGFVSESLGRVLGAKPVLTLKQFFEEIGVSVCLKDYNVSDCEFEDLKRMAQSSQRTGNSKILL